MKYSRIILVLLFISPNISWAAGYSDQGEIDYLYQRSSDGLLGVYKKGGDWSNPDNCDRSDRIVLTRNNSSRAEFYSAILATKMSNSNFAAYVSGCVSWNGDTYPEIVGIYTY